jgi:hypothetical protein
MFIKSTFSFSYMHGGVREYCHKCDMFTSQDLCGFLQGLEFEVKLAES